MANRRDMRGRRRGMALVMVLVFGVGAFAIAITILTLSNASANAEGSRHRDKTLQSIARYGMATAINEINMNRTAAAGDPTGNGPGCILIGPDGRRGWPVYDGSTPQPRLLGRFTTMVRTSPVLDPTTGSPTGKTERVLEIVAVDGEFPADSAAATALLNAGRLRYLTAELEIESFGVEFDRNALSVRGPARRGFAAGKGGFRAIGPGPGGSGAPSANQVTIKALDSDGDGVPDVPAVNITDPDFYAFFKTNAQISAWKEVSGLNPDTMSAAVNRVDTVTNSESGLINQQSMGEIAAGVNARVSEVMTTGTRLRDAYTDDTPPKAVSTLIDAAGNLTGNVSLPAGEYYIDTPLNIPSGYELKGKGGTLVINKGVNVKKTLDWKGDVIIANNAQANVYVESGGRMTVSNVLSVQGYGFSTPTEMGIRIKGELVVGTAAKPGVYTILGDANTRNPLRFDSGASGATVNGIFSIMGNGLEMSFGSGAKIYVNGSMALITPDDATKGIDIQLQNGDHVELKYTKGGFDGAVSALGAFFVPDDGGNEPIQPTTYLESAASRRGLLEKHVDADEAGEFGLN